MLLRPLSPLAPTALASRPDALSALASRPLGSRRLALTADALTPRHPDARALFSLLFSLSPSPRIASGPSRRLVISAPPRLVVSGSPPLRDSPSPPLRSLSPPHRGSSLYPKDPKSHLLLRRRRLTAASPSPHRRLTAARLPRSRHLTLAANRSQPPTLAADRVSVFRSVRCIVNRYEFSPDLPFFGFAYWKCEIAYWKCGIA
ncbi:hypothetical protein Cni_G22143 [Canna indica]|uniref:Uncharacterized protein n=1 Tax=Canna indica TaxID=4628 RepID=A0AAQ3KUK8_9LILI|nr:hypothetical protein Cni_G22143 [Canna indica]